jgi:tetratricopeptide (TPR) repeat protein
MAIDRMRELLRESERLAHAGNWGAEALEANRQLAELSPGAAGVHRRLGLCLEEACDYGAALRELEQAVALAGPGSPIAEMALPELDRVRARVEAGRVRAFQHAQAKALSLRSVARVDEALIWHERAAELAATAADEALALASWAATLRPLRRLDQEAQLVSRAIALDPSRRTNRIAYTVKIAVLVDQRKLEAGVREAEALLAEHPNDRVVLSTAGRAFTELAKKTGDPSLRERARGCFARAHA